MTFPQLKLAQLQLELAVVRFRKGRIDAETLPATLEILSDALGELAEYLDKPNPEKSTTEAAPE